MPDKIMFRCGTTDDVGNRLDTWNTAYDEFADQRYQEQKVEERTQAGFEKTISKQFMGVKWESHFIDLGHAQNSCTELARAIWSIAILRLGIVQAQVHSTTVRRPVSAKRVGAIGSSLPDHAFFRAYQRSRRTGFIRRFVLPNSLCEVSLGVQRSR